MNIADEIPRKDREMFSNYIPELQLTATVSNLWPFLGLLKIHQETDLISELRVAQTKLSRKLVTQ